GGMGVQRGGGVLRVRQGVARLLVGQVGSDDVGPAPLRRVAEEPARGAHFENALSVQVDAPEVVVDAAAEVPRALDEPVPRDLHRVVEVALLELGDDTRLRVNEGLFGRLLDGFMTSHEAAPYRTRGYNLRVRRPLR